MHTPRAALSKERQLDGTPSTRPTISVVIISCNEAGIIEQCLQSVVNWVDDIVVVDMCSTDGTREIVGCFRARVVDHPRLTYVEPARNFALEQAMGDWILMLDPDERVPAPLGRELQRIAAEEQADVVMVPYVHVNFGRAMRSPGASDIPHPRFFRRGAVSWPAEVHTSPDVSGLRCYSIPVSAPGLAIHHESWRSIGGALDKIIRYAPQDAENLRARGQRFSLGAMFYNMTGQFVHRMVIGRAYEDGMVGFLTALLFAFYNMLIYAHLWEVEGREPQHDRPVERWGYCAALPYTVGKILARVMRRVVRL
jgi:glycosyltransferase involved in cell wall biosynthesis